MFFLWPIHFFNDGVIYLSRRLCWFTIFFLWDPPFSILLALGLQVYYHTWISHNFLKDDTTIKIEKTVKNPVFRVFSFSDSPFSKL